MALSKTYLQLLRDYRAYHDHWLCELTHVVGIPMLAAAAPVALFAPVWGLGLLVGGALLQGLGHAVVGNRPKFMRDKRNVVVGAIWWLDTVLRPLGLSQRLFGPKDTPRRTQP